MTRKSQSETKPTGGFKPAANCKRIKHAANCKHFTPNASRKHSSDAIVGRVLVECLKRHERISQSKARRIAASIARRGLRKPLVVDGASFTVLDGHHRLEALRMLGCQYAPAVLVDYSHESVKLAPRRKKISVSKKKVVARAARGKPFPRKTTRHTLEFKLPKINAKIKELLKA